MKKMYLILLTFFIGFCSMAQINVSTSTNAGAYVTPPNQDPNWVVSGQSGPSAQAYAQQSYPGFWQPTPINVTNAGWINPSPNQSEDTPGVYTFERSFSIDTCTATFACNFSVAWDDILVSLVLVRPDATTIPLTWVANSQPYFLSNPITNVINSPATGIWKIRAKVKYIDELGGFMLSGYINPTLGGCCDSTCRISLIVGGLAGSPFSCGSALNMQCNKNYDFNPRLTCMNSNTTAILGVTLKDGNGNTPAWAAAFIAAGGNGLLSIPAGISGLYTITYAYGINGKICGTCKYKLNITCQCCAFTNSVKTTSGIKKLKCADSLLLACNTSNTFAPTLNNCINPGIHFTNVVFVDAVTLLTPTWINQAFLNNLGNGNLLIPSGVSGIFTLKYIWGQNCSACDSCSYTVKIQCTGAAPNAAPQAENSSQVKPAAIQVYPNPTTNSFKVSGLQNRTALLEIVNLTGITAARYINIADGNSFGGTLPKGIYLLRFSFKDGTTQSLQLIKN